MHISQTLIVHLQVADTVAVLLFAVEHYLACKPTDTKPLFHSLAMNKLESNDGLDFFAKISFMKRKKYD